MNFSWVVSEAVQEVTFNSKIIAKLMSIFELPEKYYANRLFDNWYRFIDLAKSPNPAANAQRFVDEVLDFEKDLPDGHPMVKKLAEYATSIRELITKTETHPGDLVNLKHFGFTTSGNLVVLDYGYTAKIARDLYYQNPVSVQGSTSSSTKSKF